MDGVFATLTPANGHAKLAFSKVAALCMQQPPPFCSDFMHIGLEQIDTDVGVCHDGDDSSDNSDDTTSADEAGQSELCTLWPGYYVFQLSNRDPAMDVSWIAGKGRPKGPLSAQGVHFQLQHDDFHLRGMHARFVLDQSGYIGITPFSHEAQDITLDGVPADRLVLSLNQGSHMVGIGPMQFAFTYTNYSRGEEFKATREKFWTQARLRSAQAADLATLALTPVPAEQAQRFGQWTLAKQLGRGSGGKVYSATNSSATAVAIKVLERDTGSAPAIWKEIDTLKKLTRRAKKAGCINIILLQDVIGNVSPDEATDTVFQDIALITTPLAHCTMDAIIASNEPLQYRMHLFQGLLNAIDFLHTEGWVHRDVKPANVGITERGAILLDMGHVENIGASYLPPTPGMCGTIGYLAPEQEMSHYDYGVDVWAAGIVGLALLTDRFFLRMSTNPWQEGQEHLRDRFHRRYRQMCKELRGPDLGCKLAGDLILQMLRFPLAKCNRGPRITVGEALAHPLWKEVEESDEEARYKKKARH